MCCRNIHQRSGPTRGGVSGIIANVGLKWFSATIDKTPELSKNAQVLTLNITVLTMVIEDIFSFDYSIINWFVIGKGEIEKRV